MNTPLKTALLVAALFAPIAAHAGELTLFLDANFGGRELTLRDATPNLVDLGFNDKASSIVVHSGRWEVCEHAEFRGTCAVFDRGEYPSLRFNDKISSVREVGRPYAGRPYRDRDEPGGRGMMWREEGRARGPGRDEGEAAVELFDSAQFGGARVPLRRDVNDLKQFDFNDRAGSIVVNEGEWEFCVHGNFGGQCAIYGPGNYPHLGPMSRQISSIRRVR